MHKSQPLPHANRCELRARVGARSAAASAFAVARSGHGGQIEQGVEFLLRDELFFQTTSRTVLPDLCASWASLAASL